MIDKKLVEKKIRRIEDFLRELKQVKITTLEDFQENIVVKRFVERNIELAQNGVIPDEEADTFKAMVRFRNILIHIYDGIDDSITYGVYKKHLQDFKVFAGTIRSFLRRPAIFEPE